MDPRIERLIERYAYARGDLLLRRGRRGDQPPSAEVLAGWALERARGDVLNAITLLKSLRTGKWAAERGRQQRAAAIAELRSLTKTYDLTKPVVMRP